MSLEEHVGSALHKEEVRRGKRFAFGINWRKYSRHINEERIREAEKSLIEFLGMEDLRGKTFLDIGCGSGLFSLAARRLGAEVLSFDYDPESVLCTAEMRRRYFEGDPAWRITEGSVLDREFLKSLGQFDIVYSWGVLHHTGAMWEALGNVIMNTKAGGLLFIAIYNDCGEISRYWLRKKIKYNRLPGPLRLPYAVWTWAPIELKQFLHYLLNKNPSGYIALWTEYKKSRGMSRWYDMIDWLGGYPYEYATAEQLTDFYKGENFILRKLVPNNGYGCHQLMFERKE